MSWKQHFTYKTAHYVEAPVGDETNVVRFYPNQLGILEQLTALSTPVTRAINLFVGAEGRDYATHTKSMTEGEGKTLMAMEETTIEAVDIEAKRERIRQREEAIETLTSMFSDKRNIRLLGIAWMDSMKDIFPRTKGGPSPDQVEEFLFGDGKEYEGLEVPQMLQIMTGWLRANSKVFGDMGEKLVGFVRAQMESRLQNGSTSDEIEPNPTNGGDSKTPSSPPSDTASV